MEFRKIYPEFKVLFKGDLDILSIKTNKNFLIFSSKLNSKLIEIPWFVVVKKTKDEIFFKNLDTNFVTFSKFAIFQKKLLYLLQTLDKTYKKHLIIRGLGMRINYLRVLHKLQLKLGFSNLIIVDVPKSIRVLKRKDALTLEGNNSVIVGNFANLIKSFRYPDSYKGKGIWYKNELRSLKPVKKV